MSDFYQHAASVFMGFFAIMNPIANTAVFVGLVGDRSKAEQTRVAIKAVVVDFPIVAVFAVIGVQMLIDSVGAVMADGPSLAG